MVRPLRYLGQVLAYALFAAVIGYFSTTPVYKHLPSDQALVKLSFRHAAQRKGACRERTDEELAKLPPNMRVRQVCPRERADVVVELEVDGQPMVQAVLPPSGITHDSAATIYRRFSIPAGTHRFEVRLKDAVEGDFGYKAEKTLTLEPGRVLVIDFNAVMGGFSFRG